MSGVGENYWCHTPHIWLGSKFGIPGTGNSPGATARWTSAGRTNLGTPGRRHCQTCGVARAGRPRTWPVACGRGSRERPLRHGHRTAQLGPARGGACHRPGCDQLGVILRGRHSRRRAARIRCASLMPPPLLPQMVSECSFSDNVAACHETLRRTNGAGQGCRSGSWACVLCGWAWTSAW